MKSLEPVWHNKSEAKLLDLPGQYLQELMTDNSLTIRITNACAGKFSVKVIEQRQALILHSEALALGIKPGLKAKVRQVLLICNKTPVIFARTIMPLKFFNRSALRLSKLGSKSLGTVLYSQRSTIRHQTQISILNQSHYIYGQIQDKCHLKPSNEVYGRRNLYKFDGQKLLVNEIYLPAFWQQVF